MYRSSPAYYDLIYHELKDYAEEAERLDYLLNRLEPRPRRLLDIGCGTGEHALHLSRDYGYQVDGLDISPEFVQIAQSKLPSAKFQVADMREFDLGRTYDALLCLFSSIGYTQDEEGLKTAFASMARHLEPGGWLICEPWVTPEEWQAGQVDVTAVTDPSNGTTITRTRRGSTRGNTSILKIEYDVNRSGQPTQSFQEEHILGLFTRSQMSNALEANGFQPRWMERGLHQGSLILARFWPSSILRA